MWFFSVVVNVFVFLGVIGFLCRGRRGSAGVGRVFLLWFYMFGCCFLRLFRG